MTREHVAGLESAARDGDLWNLRVTSVPAPGEAPAYVDAALQDPAFVAGELPIPSRESR